MPAEIDDLEQASRSAAKVVWGDVPGPVVGEAIKAMVRARAAQDAALLAAVRSFSARGEHRADGHTNVANWLQHTCGMRRREALRIARLSRFVDHEPALAEALAAARISFDHVEVFANAHRERHAEAWTEAWPHLVDDAEASRFVDVERAVQRFAIGLNPRAADERFREQVEGRWFRKAITLDGFGTIDGWFDPVTYAILAAEHDRLVEIEYQADWAAARELLGRDPTAAEVQQHGRGAQQRAADAMRIMAQRSKTLAGGAVAAAVEVVIHMTEEEYEAGLARLMGDDEAEYPTAGLSELADGTPISPIAGAYLSLIGAFRRIVYGADDEIVGYSRARGYTETQKAALRAKDRRCRHPYGCDRTGRGLQGDHVHEYEDGGRTEIANGQSLCGFHNRWKNQNKGRPPPTTRRDTGARRARGPDLC